MPSIIGFGAVLSNLSALLDNVPMATTIVGATAAWLVLWSFLSGGVLDRYARMRPTRAPGFFAACGTHFWRFLRLGILSLADLLGALRLVHPWLFEDVYPWITRNVTVERTAFAIRLSAISFRKILILSNLVFDYARIRIVVEDRRSAVGACSRAPVRQASSVGVALYLVNGGGLLLLALL